MFHLNLHQHIRTPQNLVYDNNSAVINEMLKFMIKIHFQKPFMKPNIPYKKKRKECAATLPNIR